jgi:hypothetical protein
MCDWSWDVRPELGRATRAGKCYQSSTVQLGSVTKVRMYNRSHDV